MSLHFEPLQREPAYRAIFNQIERRILSGEIQVGSQFPSELALAGQMGVNRSTVREAIRLLEERGLLRREGGKRLFVSVPRSIDLSRRMTAAMVLRQVSFQELWETMMALEPTAAEHAAERISDDDLAALEANLERTRAAVADSQSLTALDIEFHALVAKAAGNRALQLARQPLSQLFYPAFYRVISKMNAGERLLTAHQRIVQALAQRDPADAKDWMTKHIVDFKRGYALAELDLAAPVVAEAETP